MLTLKLSYDYLGNVDTVISKLSKKFNIPMEYTIVEKSNNFELNRCSISCY
jgi:hypothetical protein